MRNLSRRLRRSLHGETRRRARSNRLSEGYEWDRAQEHLINLRTYWNRVTPKVMYGNIKSFAGDKPKYDKRNNFLVFSGTHLNVVHQLDNCIIIFEDAEDDLNQVSYEFDNKIVKWVIMDD